MAAHQTYNDIAIATGLMAMDQDIKDLIEILRKRLDLEVEDLEPTEAAKVRKDVESFISRIERHPDRLDLIDEYLATIEMQYVKQKWRKAVYKNSPR